MFFLLFFFPTQLVSLFSFVMESALSRLEALPLELMHQVLSYLDWPTLLRFLSLSHPLRAAATSYLKLLARLPSGARVSTTGQLISAAKLCPRLTSLPLICCVVGPGMVLQACDFFPNLQIIETSVPFVPSIEVMLHPVAASALTRVTVDAPSNTKAWYLAKMPNLRELVVVGGAEEPLLPSPHLEDLTLSNMFMEDFAAVGPQRVPFFHAGRFPRLKQLVLEELDLQAFLPCFSTLAAHPRLSKLSIENCEVPPAILGLKFPHVTTLAFEGIVCNNGLLLTCVREYLPQLHRLLVALPVSLVHGLEGVTSALSALELRLQLPDLGPEEIAASPVEPRFGVEDAHPGVSLAFLSGMPSLTTLGISPDTDGAGVWYEVKSEVSFPNVQGDEGWLQSLTELSLYSHTCLPSLQQVFPLMSSLTDLFISNFDVGQEPLTLANPSVTRLEFDGVAHLNLGAMPRLVSLCTPASFSVQQELPELKRLEIENHLLPRSQKQWTALLGGMVSLAPKLDTIHTNCYQPEIAQAFMELRCLLCPMESVRDLRFFEEAGRLMRLRGKPAEKVAVRPVPSLPELAVELRKLELTPAMMVENYSQARTILCYSYHRVSQK